MCCTLMWRFHSFLLPTVEEHPYLWKVQMKGRVCDAKTCFLRADSEVRPVEQWAHGSRLGFLPVGGEDPDVLGVFFAILVGFTVWLVVFLVR